MRKKLVVTAGFAAVLLFAGCSSSDSSTDSSPSSTTATDSDSSDSGSSDSDSSDSASSGPESVDACALADPALLQALGVAGEGEALDRGGENGPADVAWNVCTWNAPIVAADDPFNIVTVQVLTEGPDAVVNPLEMFLSALDSPTPVDVGTNGKIYEGGLIAGGGGVGKTIAFEAEGGKLITVSQTAEVVDVAALTALAQGVEANL
ncbi:MAG: hypothetical protein NTX58_06230 [Actinobacteria bacterium]|nr:hypothetical protein [Actinomycetota bacterium]